MPILTTEEIAFAEAVGALTYCNPFLPERIEAEKVAAGSAFIPHGDVWSVKAGEPGPLVSQRRGRLALSPDGHSKGVFTRKGKVSVYDVSGYPEERRVAPDAQEPDLTALRAAFFADVSRGRAGKLVDPTDETLEALRALGYLTDDDGDDESDDGG